jgi:MFS transporter, Spinster family, sphingosine-1-phosphate transporter
VNPARPWLLVGFMWVAYCLNYADRQVIFSVFPVIKAELKLTDTVLGLTGSVFLWVYALCSVIAGELGDRFSKKTLVALSLLLWSAVTALTGLAASAVALLACRALIGVTEALFMPAAVALTAGAHVPAARSRAIALFDTAQLAGVVLGGWLGGVLAQQGHWRWAFFVLGGLGILYALPYLRFLQGVPTPADAATPRAGGRGFAAVKLLGIPTYRVLCVVFPSFTFVLWVLYTWLPTFFYEKFSLPLDQAGFAATAYLQGGTLAGLLLGGWIADRLYRRTRRARLWLVSAGLFVCAPCLYFVGNADTLLITQGAAVGFGLGSGLFIANLFPSSFDIAPASLRASSVGCLNLIGAFVSGFATLLAGSLKDRVGIGALLTCGSVLCAGSGLFLVMGTRRCFERDHERALET